MEHSKIWETLKIAVYESRLLRYSDLHQRRITMHRVKLINRDKSTDIVNLTPEQVVGMISGLTLVERTMFWKHQLVFVSPNGTMAKLLKV